MKVTTKVKVDREVEVCDRCERVSEVDAAPYQMIMTGTSIPVQEKALCPRCLRIVQAAWSKRKVARKPQPVAAEGVPNV